MVNQIYYAYDIHLNNFNQLVIAKYRISESSELVKGKPESNYKYEYLGFELHEDIEKRLVELYREGYLPINKFRNVSFDVDIRSPLVFAKLLLLGLNHQLLEKFYRIGSGYDYDVTAYITYINMITGEISSMKVGNYGAFSDEKIKELEDWGYIPHEKSFAYSRNLQHSKDEGKKR